MLRQMLVQGATKSAISALNSINNIKNGVKSNTGTTTINKTEPAAF